jgi:hypothetical protein
MESQSRQHALLLHDPQATPTDPAGTQMVHVRSRYDVAR